MPPPLYRIERDERAIVTITQQLSNGQKDPVLDVFRAHPIDGSGGVDPDSDLFVLVDVDPFCDGNSPVGVIEVAHVEEGPDHLGLKVNEDVLTDVAEIGVAVKGLMEKLHESQVIIATRDTNLSRSSLRRMGGVGLRRGDFMLTLPEAA
jgi:hypothetical protein